MNFELFARQRYSCHSIHWDIVDEHVEAIEYILAVRCSHAECQRRGIHRDRHVSRQQFNFRQMKVGPQHLFCETHLLQPLFVRVVVTLDGVIARPP